MNNEPLNPVGPRLRRLRQLRALDVETLAQRSGLSPEMIRGLENGNLVPSLTPLMKIAHALDTRLGTLLDDQTRDAPVLVRASDPTQTISFSGNDPTRVRASLSFHPLAPEKIDRHMEPFLIDVHPAPNAPRLDNHEGEEFLYVLSGKLEILYGKDVYRLNPGDSIYYDSVVPHHVHALEEGTKILAVVYAPA